MAGAAGARLNTEQCNNQRKQQENGNGWRRGEEDSQGQGR